MNRPSTSTRDARVGRGDLLDPSPAPPAIAPRRQGRVLRWVAVAVGAGLLVPLLYLLGGRIGKDPTFVRSPLLGKPAPAFDLARVDAPGRVRSADLAGRVYVVNFWASWCVPCREENGALRAFYERYRDDGVEVVGVMYADRREDALAFRRELGGGWPLVDDPGGRVALDYGVRGVPETFVVDDQGVVMARFLGALAPGTLESVIEQLRAGSGPITGSNDRYRTSPG